MSVCSIPILPCPFPFSHTSGSHSHSSISGADLVKAVVFQPTDPKNMGTDIFQRLIPMQVHEAASVYSEEKAKLLRSIMLSVQEKDDDLE